MERCKWDAAGCVGTQPFAGARHPERKLTLYEPFPFIPSVQILPPDSPGLVLYMAALTGPGCGSRLSENREHHPGKDSGDSAGRLCED